MEPRRLLDDAGNDAAKDLVRAALQEKSNGRGKSAVLAALGVSAAGVSKGAAAAGIAHGAASSSGSVASAIVVKWFLGGALVGVALTGTHHYVQQAPEHGPSVQVITSSGPTAPPSEVTVVVSTPGASASTEQTVEGVVKSFVTQPDATPSAALLDEEGASPQPPEVPNVGPVPATEARDGLAEELRSLDQARYELRAGRPTQCLDRIARYQQAYPQGRLRPEAFLLQLEALVHAGRKAEARELAKGHLSSPSKGPYERRIQRILEP